MHAYNTVTLDHEESEGWGGGEAVKPSWVLNTYFKQGGKIGKRWKSTKEMEFTKNNR